LVRNPYHSVQPRRSELELDCLAAKREGFTGCRSRGQTELAQTYPTHLDCESIGNSQAIAAKHYRQTTDEHFAMAATEPIGAQQEALPKTAEAERKGSARKKRRRRKLA